MSPDPSRSGEPVDVPDAVVQLARAARRVVVLTGAGMSAESGVPTFRDAQTGLWSRFRAEDLATPEAWERDAAFVWAWYLWRFERVRNVAPHDGHLALARWSQADTDGREVSIVTQNVDDLHERAGSDDVVHLHGQVTSFRCDTCARPHEQEVEPPEQEVERVDPPDCGYCGGQVRPGVVWFGEALPGDQWERAEQAVESADLVLVVGTSGLVYPAAGLPAMARARGATVVEVNPVETEISDIVHHIWRETAARSLPALVDAALG